MNFHYANGKGHKAIHSFQPCASLMRDSLEWFLYPQKQCKLVSTLHLQFSNKSVQVYSGA